MSMTDATGPTSLFPPIPLDSSDPAVQAAYANSHELFGHVADMFARLAHAPALLGGWIDMLRPIRRELQVDPRLSELLTIRVAQLQGTTLMVDSHVRLAGMAGVPEAVVAAVDDQWRSSKSLGELERMVLELAEQLTTDSVADDALLAGLQDRIGTRETLELVVVASYYCCTTRVANVLRPLALRFEGDEE